MTQLPAARIIFGQKREADEGGLELLASARPRTTQRPKADAQPFHEARSADLFRHEQKGPEPTCWRRTQLWPDHFDRGIILIAR